METTMLSLAVLSLFLLASRAEASAAQTEPVGEPNTVGFIWHYPFSEVGADAIAASGANAMMARCNWPTIQPDENTFDFTSIRRQLDAARNAGLRVVLLLEFNPFCTPAWLKEKCARAGEDTRGYDDQPGTMPQMDSPILREAQREMLVKLKAVLDENDAGSLVTHYMPGIEWWFPPSEQYAARDAEGFHEWLAAKYGIIEQLNARWGAEFGSFDEVPCPALDNTALFAKERQGLDTVHLTYRRDGLEKEQEPSSPIAVCEDWSAYWNEKAADYINSLATLVKEIDPSRPCVSFLTLAWAQFAEWDYVTWSQVRLDSALAAGRDLDAFGMQLCFAAGDSYRLTAGLDMARKYGKPMWDLDLLDFVKGVASGYAAHEKNTHAAIQHGAHSLLYCCWNGATDFNFYPDWPIEQTNRLLSDARAAYALLNGATLVADAAIINPIVASAPGDPTFGRNDVRSLMGWYKIIERLPATVDVVTLRGLENDWAGLKPYRWVLVPDCPYLSDAALARLRAYEEAGGTIIRGGRLGGFHASGKPRLYAAVPGIPFEDLGFQYAGDALPRQAFAGDTPPQMIWRPETDNTHATLAKALTDLRRILTDRGLPPGTTVSAGTQDIRCTEFRRGTERIIYLVNMDPAPATGLVLTPLDTNLHAKSVHADLQDLPAAQHGPAIELPAFRTSCIVCLEEE
jgi:hypothetical protein